MSNWRLVRLNFGRNLVHFGEVGIGIEETSERVRSDTLFSAWVSTYARLFGKRDVAELFQRFHDQPRQPPFQLSSTFLFQRKKDEYIDYLPKPLVFPKHYPQGEDDLAFSKTYKKLTYLPLSVWRRWYQGEGFTAGDRTELIAETTGKESSHRNLRNAGAFDYGNAYKKHSAPKVAIDRTTRATNFYHTGFVQFSWKETPHTEAQLAICPYCTDKGLSPEWPDTAHTVQSLSGLYFLLYLPQADEKLEVDLHAALHLLGEDGLGGERSSGAGRFAVQWSPLPKSWQIVVKPLPETLKHCLISLFWNDDPDQLAQLIQDPNKVARYAIQERGGWIATPFSGRQLRRQMVRMFTEGSVFPAAPQGKLANTTPPEFKTADGGYHPHPVYRSGISLSLPIGA